MLAGELVWEDIGLSVWRAIVMLLTLRCDDSTRLMSADFERDLSGVERWAVRLHSISCGYCRRYGKQLSILQDAAVVRGNTTQELPEDARRRLSAAIQRALDSER